MVTISVESPPWALQSGSFSAEQTRRAVFMWAARTAANTPGILQGGLASATDCQVTAPVSGLSVNVSTGEMLIPGNEGGTQGGAYARVSSLTNAVVATANPTNPRIDRIVALMSDAGYTEPTGGSGSQWAISVVTGTATAGASLSNLSGAAAVPGSSLLLANLLVPATATNIVTADIANVATAVTVSPAIAGVGGPSVRGAVNIAATQTTTSATFTTLATPDQVTGIVMPTNGLIQVWYQAQWFCSVASDAKAAIFLNGIQLEITSDSGAGFPAVQTATCSASTIAQPLTSFQGGLVADSSGAITAPGADATTGQVVAQQLVSSAVVGGPAAVFAAAGTYTVSVQFLAVGGATVTVRNRKLWVQALPFS